MAADLLGPWECLATPAGQTAQPGDLNGAWMAAVVPGTAAAALRAANLPYDRDLDAEDWWFRSRFASLSTDIGPWKLRLDGLATIADVWLNGAHVLHSENMFLGHALDLAELAAQNELVIRFAALTPLLDQRRPRPRWKAARLKYPTLRWFRTTLLGRLVGWVRTPAPVGPWRPVTLTARRSVELTECHLDAHCHGSDGTVTVQLRVITTGPALQQATLHVGETSSLLAIEYDGTATVITGEADIANVERWWPHTHGRPHRYPVEVEVGTVRINLGTVAFRTIEVDREKGGFRVLVNGVDVFCRGAYWTPLDPVSLVDDPMALRTALEQFRDANLNMVRIGGETVYPSDLMLDLLDELGILLWQDCMFAFYDIPDDDDLLESISGELAALFARLGSHPCLAVVSGGSEIEQQAALVGISAERRTSAVDATVRVRVEEALPGIAYVPSTPTGGPLPIEPREGIAHYYGVGAYLRPLDDARRAGVRFAAECLAFATPPERGTVDDECGGAARAGHHPSWKAAVHRDAGASWDFEDVTAHYSRTLFDVEPSTVRWTDPERALDLARATVAHVFDQTWAEWRRPASTCSGALVFHYGDLAPGAGLGIVDSLGRPKAPWYVLRRAAAPIAVLVTDEGLNGLDAHVLNDSPERVEAVLRVELFAHGEIRTEVSERPVALRPHTAVTVALSTLFDGFRDLSYAYLFGPPPHDVVAVSLVAARGTLLSQFVHLIGGPARQAEHDLGLRGVAVPVGRGPEGDLPDIRDWRLTITTRRFAQWVVIDVPGFQPSDNWFHLPPGSSKIVDLTSRGHVFNLRRSSLSAYNATGPTKITQ